MVATDTENPDSHRHGGANQRAEEQPKTHKTTLPQWIEAVCAVALVFITGFYTHYASQQAQAAIDGAKAASDNAKVAKDTLTEMRSNEAQSTEQTRKLIEQAKAQADAAKAQSEQAKAQTVKMGKSLGRTDKLIGATNDLAIAAKRQANAQMLQFELQQRAYAEAHGAAFLYINKRWGIGLYKLRPDPRTEVAVAFSTLDNRPVKNILLNASLEFRSHVPTIYASGPVLQIPDSNCLKPQEGQCAIRIAEALPLAGYMDYMAGKKKLYVWGTVSYEDASGRDSIVFCRYISSTDVKAVPTAPPYPGPTDKGFADCSSPTD